MLCVHVTGKSGPEYSGSRRGSDHYLLAGSVPLPKPSVTTPRHVVTSHHHRSVTSPPAALLSQSCDSLLQAQSVTNRRRASLDGALSSRSDSTADAAGDALDCSHVNVDSKDYRAHPRANVIFGREQLKFVQHQETTDVNSISFNAVQFEEIRKRFEERTEFSRYGHRVHVSNIVQFRAA